MSDINNTQKNSSNTSQKNIFGVIGVIIGLIAWGILYKNQWIGLGFAFLGIITSIIGLRGRFRNWAIFGIISSCTLLIVVGVMWIVFYYLFQSIK